MCNNYRKQAEQDLLFTIKDLAERENLSSQDATDLHNKTRAFLDSLKFDDLSWEEVEYFKVKDLFRSAMVDQHVKLRATLRSMQTPEFVREDDTSVTYLTFQDPDGGRTISSWGVTNEALIDKLEEALEEYATFDVLGTVFPHPSTKPNREAYRLLVHDMRVSHNCLQIVQAKRDEIDEVKKLIERFKKQRENIFSYIKKNIVQHLGIVGLDRSPLLDSSIDAMIVQAFSDGFIDERLPGKLHTLIIGAPSIGKQLLAHIARILNPVFQEAHPSKVTVAGVCSTAEQRRGGWVSRPGYIPLAHCGVFAIQDFHNIKDSQKGKLLGIFSMVMEEGIAIDATAAMTNHQASTSIHLDLNKRTDLFPESKQRGNSIIAQRLNDIEIPMSTLSRFDFVVDIPRDTQRQMEIGLQKYRHRRMTRTRVRKAVTHKNPWERQLQVLVAYLRDEHLVVDFSDRVIENMQKRQLSIIEKNEAQFEAIPFFGDFQTRLANSVFKFVAAFARMNHRGKAALEDVEAAFRLIARKLEFIQTLERQLKLPTTWEAPQRAELDDWLRERFMGRTVKTRDILKEYEGEFNIPLERRTLTRHLNSLLALGDVKRLRQGVYSFRKLPIRPPKSTPSERALIPGCMYLSEYIEESKERELIKIIDIQPWSRELKRRVQHYGYKYDYKNRQITHDMYLGPLPEWLQDLSRQLHERGAMPQIPDQVIVNEYKPGQGIAPHVDCEPCFGDTIASLSLQSGIIMEFKSTTYPDEEVSLWLEPRSLLVLSGDARYVWRHGIQARKSDFVNAEKRQRSRRLSLTFRKVII